MGKFPRCAQILGRNPCKLARRVIVDTNADRIITDEIVHHRSYVSYLRDTLPPGIENIRIDYYRKENGFRRGEDSSCSDSQLSEAESDDSTQSANGFYVGGQLPAGFQIARRAEKEQTNNKQ